MAETYNRIPGSKAEQYQGLLPQVKALLEGETDFIANAGNLCAVLKQQFDFFWVGFYLVKGNELVLGPFQGPLACTRIQKGKGVCGRVWETEQSLIVPDVDAFPGHIACNSRSRSEIVLPVLHEHTCVAVLDIDSEHPDHFDAIDEQYLKQILDLLTF